MPVCVFVHRHEICMRSPLLLPDYGKGTLAALALKSEQIQDHQGPAPGTRTKQTETHVPELVDHICKQIKAHKQIFSTFG